MTFDLPPDVMERAELAIAAHKTLTECRTIEDWHHIANTCCDLRAQAIRLTNHDSGKTYNAAWNSLAESIVPGVVPKDKAARANLVWLGTNWDEIDAWRSGLDIEQQMELVHPKTIRKEYTKAHRPETVKKPKAPPKSLLETLAGYDKGQIAQAIKHLWPETLERLEFGDTVGAGAIVDEIDALVANDIAADANLTDEQRAEELKRRCVDAVIKLPPRLYGTAMMDAVADAVAATSTTPRNASPAPALAAPPAPEPAAINGAAAPAKRRGRPPGAKNKVRAEAAPPPRKRGRPAKAASGHAHA